MAKTIPTTLAVLILAAPCSFADTLLLDGIEMDTQTSSMRPRAGMSMSAVESTYGTPSERRSPVGEPPITRWDYPGFSVYFEHEIVLHAVARRQ
jgi:hypothetical protein